MNLNIFRSVISKNQFRYTKVAGFTLIELLVVISIIGMLSSVVLASLSTAREKGRLAAGQKFAGYTYRALGADAHVIYDFNDVISGGSATVIDQSGNSRSGTVQGSVLSTTNTPVNSGKAFQFNGSNYIRATLSNPLNINNGHTISMWIYPTSVVDGVTTNKLVASIGYPTGSPESSGYGNYITYFLSGTSGQPSGITYRSATSWGNYPLNTINLNKWTHIALSRKNNSLEIYVNGKLEGNVTSGLFYSSFPNPVASFAIADYETGTGGRFNGYMDDFAIYSRALTASEINHIYAQGAKEKGLALEN